jgi:hypothetical protein
MKRWLVGWAGLWLLGVALAAGGEAADFFVGPGGDDGNPGTAERPFATLARAQQALRARAEGQGATVSVRGGAYYLDAPLIFTAADSGSVDAPLVFAAAEGETVVVSGGQRLQLDWRPYRDGIFQSATPAGLEIDQLFVNGRNQPMARYPNFDPQVAIYNGYAADAFSRERAARWSDPVGGYIHAMHRAHWGGYHYRITGKKPDGSVVYEGGWQNNRQMGMHPEHRFVENIFEELDAPGEWYHDAANRVLYFYPPPELKLDEATFEVARLRHLIEFRGEPQSPVRHVQLRGLTFRHAARTFMDTNEPLLRSDWTIYRGGAVFFDGAEDCEVIDCRFDQLGGNAVMVSNYNRRVAVRGCLISDSGASGVAFVGDPHSVRSPLFEYHQRQSFDQIDRTPGPQSENYPADCLIEDCLIRRVGCVEKQAAGVQISMAARITVRHCSIYETPRAGINISEGTFGGHLIEFCDVFDTVLETGDHGSFNSWGRDRFWGLKDAPDDQLADLALLDMPEPNVIRFSRWRCDHGWDIDLDDGSSSYHVYKNLMLHGGLKFREGFHRIAENNILVNNSFHPHVWYPNSRDVFRRNIVFTPYRPIRVERPWGEVVDHNLLHRPDWDPPQPAEVLQQQSGRDSNSLMADARFVDPAAGDYRVQEGSPALTLGFQNFPMDRFGVQKPQWKEIARTPNLPAVRTLQTQETTVVQQPVRVWLQARVRELEGEEFSAFGVSRDAGGVHLAEVPDESLAAASGLRTNDVVQSLNGQPVKRLADLYRLQDAADGRPLTVGLVRGQQTQTTQVTDYPFVVTESPSGRNFVILPLAEPARTLPIRRVESQPSTANEPLETLHDGRLAENYGPVFRNDVTGGRYRVDLGSVQPISAVRTWSYHQHGKRGSQHWTLYASASAQDPGWDVDDANRFQPIAEVNTMGMAIDRFQATSVQRAGNQPLGAFRWLIWVVRPVTAIRENTAMQEFQVIPAR